MFKKVLQRKLRVGRFGMPLWILGLTGGLMAAAAGQAVGPVLAGSVTGTVGATVEQTVLVDAVTVSGADDSVAVVNDEATSFTVAIETQVGQSQTITLTFDNQSGQAANAVLELNVPVGIDVESTGGTVDEAQLSQNKWLMNVEDNETNILTIEPKDDLKPGFYTITGRIVQIAG